MYAGAKWVESSYKKEMSPLGKAVANLLGRVFRGIYHLDPRGLERVDWSDPYCIEWVCWNEFSTVDFNELTMLVVFAHDEMIRVSMRGCGPGYMKLMFHQRKSRTGDISERYPTIETHIEQIRKMEGAA